MITCFVNTRVQTKVNFLSQHFGCILWQMLALGISTELNTEQLFIKTILFYSQNVFVNSNNMP